jgi:hypothetical protein
LSFSKLSRKALVTGIKIAKMASGRITLLYVLPRLDPMIFAEATPGATPGTTVLDAGLKCFGMDHGNPEVRGWPVFFCSDEHTTITFDQHAGGGGDVPAAIVMPGRDAKANAAGHLAAEQEGMQHGGA